ncbi:DUF448 domain-containing protein [Enhygromyxa salina]|uniref:YlxR family protein n=1 Tax=Enhygromyxa salina TaxID=215803 RepID=UPI000697B0D9
MSSRGDQHRATARAAREAVDSEPLLGPVRMCAGCRVRRAQSQLLRFGLRPGAGSEPAQVIPTLSAGRSGSGSGSGSGRTAYLCPRRECLDRAVGRRVFTRAFSSASGRRAKSGGQHAGPQISGAPSCDTISAVGPAAADALWSAASDLLRREIDLLDRCGEKTHAHLRRRGLERLLFELSSQPAPSDRRSTANRQGGTPTHG